MAAPKASEQIVLGNRGPGGVEPAGVGLHADSSLGMVAATGVLTALFAALAA